MARNHIVDNTYQGLLEFIAKGRDKRKRTVALNTVAYRGDNEANIKYHDTFVVSLKGDGSITLNTGGWYTPTTKERINWFMPAGWYVYQEKNIWYLSYGYSRQDCKRYEFLDGMTLYPNHPSYGESVFNPHGNIMQPKEKKKDAQDRKMLREISRYCETFSRLFMAGKIEKPSGGDCWYCSMVSVATGKPWGEESKNTEHLLSHIAEKYYVPSLLHRALKQYKGFAPIDRHNIACILQGKFSDVVYEAMTRDRIKKALAKYIKMQLGFAG